MVSSLLDILPAEIRTQIFEEVIKAQYHQPLQSQIVNYEPTRPKRYHVRSPFVNLLRVDKQMSAEVTACLQKVFASFRSSLMCTKFNITNSNYIALAKSRMQFEVVWNKNMPSLTDATSVYVHLGVFRYNYHSSNKFRYLGDIFWPGKIDRKGKKISLYARERPIECTKSHKHGKYSSTSVLIPTEDIVAAMGWEYPRSN